MSAGGLRWYEGVLTVARELKAELEPVSERVQIVGSLRRCLPYVRDIELLVEPRTLSDGLFGESQPDLESARRVVAQWGEIVKGGDRYIQVANVKGTDLKCDVFLVHPPANWWCLLAIRTGPQNVSQLAVMKLPKAGLFHRDGRIVDAAGNEHPVDSEEAFFAAAGMPYLEPEKRTVENLTRAIR
jgi:DNA polymerase/3'-5' exonuclease PolX